MKYLVLTILTCSTIFCWGQSISTNDLETMNEDTLTWRATVVKVPFVNKRGKEVEGMADLYLQKEDKKYFIKFRGGRLLRNEIEKYLNKEVTVELCLREGNWDTDESNHYQQSRVGKYVVLFRILE